MVITSQAHFAVKKKEDNKEKSLSDNLTEYFKSNELKTALANIGYDGKNIQIIVDRLQDYLGRYNSEDKKLDWLKRKLLGYVLECKKMCNKSIEKDRTISEKFDN